MSQKDEKHPKEASVFDTSKKERVLSPDMIKKGKSRQLSETVKSIQKTCVWTMIVSGGLMAFISILAIWFDSGYIIGRAWATFLTMVSVSIFVAVIAPLLDQIDK